MKTKEKIINAFRDKITQYKNYYNPIGDPFNQGRRQAADDFLDLISEYENNSQRGFYTYMDGSVCCKQCNKTLREGCSCYEVPHDEHILSKDCWCNPKVEKP